MRRWRFIAISVLVLALIAGIFTLFNPTRHKVRDLKDIIKSGRLLVLTDGSSIGYSRQGDSVSGFQYEIVKAFADSLGVELVITEENNPQDALDAIRVGDYDIIASVLPQTTEYQKDVLFSVPLFTTHPVLVQRLPVDSLSPRKLLRKQTQLANDTIFIADHSPYKMRLQHLSEEIAAPVFLQEMGTRNQEQMVQFVAKGIIKQTVCDELLAERMKFQYPLLDISLPLGFEQQQCWLVHAKSPVLLGKLNDFLEDFMATTDYWAIYHRYFELNNDRLLFGDSVTTPKADKKKTNKKDKKHPKQPIKKEKKSTKKH